MNCCSNNHHARFPTHTQSATTPGRFAGLIPTHINGNGLSRITADSPNGANDAITSTLCASPAARACHHLVPVSMLMMLA
jgi:hypothetical protein